jgi:hypothetical protein
MVVRVWNATAVNLHIFPDGTNDGFDASRTEWVTSVIYANPELNVPRTWHWPEYVPPVEDDPA